MEYTRLFENETQGTGTAVSATFRSDYNNNILAALRIVGTLDGGTLNIQTLDPSVNEADATDSDYKNTDDTIEVPSYYTMPYQQLKLRLKATSLGASADFTIDFIPNKK